MARRKRTPEENARREKIRELLQLANVGSMDDIQELFKDTIAEFRKAKIGSAAENLGGTAKFYPLLLALQTAFCYTVCIRK